MSDFLKKFFHLHTLRSKMLALVIPLVVLPLIIVGGLAGFISYRQAYLGITQTSKDDLDHMAQFTIDLLDAHYRQFEVYKEDKKKTVQEEMTVLTNLAYNLVEAQHRLYSQGQLDLGAAKSAARQALKEVNVGESGYIYAMTSKGQLVAHIAREGDNIYDEQDEDGRYFIRSMCQSALASSPGDVLFTVYPWRNAILGDVAPRKKMVAYRYFPQWDWIIATGGYLEETYEDIEFEKRSFAQLKERIKQKRVGQTGYIYALDGDGRLTIHPEQEGENIRGSQDTDGNFFIQEMVRNKEGWIRYPWQNLGEPEARMKIVRYLYFQPWDWVVAVGSYEDEFYREANLIKGHIIASLLVLTFFVGVIAVSLVCQAAKQLTDPIHNMIEVIHKVKSGRLEERMEVPGNDEMSELATHFNHMADIIRQNRELETSLAQQGKLASLGVLASGVAHEINNPLGIILGYAGYLEGKMGEDNPHYRFVHEIKRESKRCKKIVQDLLSYARIPKPVFEEVDLNELLEQIVDFAANHTDLQNVLVRKDLAGDLPPVMMDGDQIRQVAINLILNAGSAMPEGGEITVRTSRENDQNILLTIEDNGVGIDPEHIEKIFEPFYTTKKSGTGLGLAITRQIITLHHGSIAVESEAGKGTRFVIRLPLRQEVPAYAS
ncbi:MAG: cache domain-containing protein [Syntrophotaleaceae bacterium]